MANEEFQYLIDENEIIISNGHEPSEQYPNKLKMQINFKGEDECELSEIDFKFPMGIEEGDFALGSDIQVFAYHLPEGWTLQEISFEELEKLRKEKVSGKASENAGGGEIDHVWYLCIYGKNQDYIFAFFAPTGCPFKENPVFEVGFSNVITTAAEGETQVGCEIYDVTCISSGTYTIRKKKQEEAVRIRDFYPDKGAAYASEEIRLNWKVENAEEVILYVDGQAYPLGTAVSSCLVSPTKTTRYRLMAKNGEASDQRETMIQILPVFLKTFRIIEDASKNECEVEWEVLGSDNVEINGTKVNSKSAHSLKKSDCPRKIVLFAEGTDTDIESVLYYGTPEERKDIVHFRKTITYYKKSGFQILNVEWKGYQVELKNVAKFIRIVYQDRERNELYPIRGMDKQEMEGSWEQILTGIDPAHVCDNIFMTMNVYGYTGTDNRDYDITI